MRRYTLAISVDAHTTDIRDVSLEQVASGSCPACGVEPFKVVPVGNVHLALACVKCGRVVGALVSTVVKGAA